MQAERPRLISSGAVSQALGIGLSTLRLWESEGLIPPAQRVEGLDRRVYSEDELEAIRKIAHSRPRARKGAPALAS